MRTTRLAYFLPTLLLLSNAWGGKPNIIMIMADDMGYETVGANGCDYYKTPNIVAMANMWMRFTNAFSTPICTSSRVLCLPWTANFRTSPSLR